MNYTIIKFHTDTFHVVKYASIGYVRLVCGWKGMEHKEKDITFVYDIDNLDERVCGNCRRIEEIKGEDDHWCKCDPQLISNTDICIDCGGLGILEEDNTE